MPGSPDIGATIFAKIETARAFVADVTLVGTTTGGKPTPNPNVLIELGYALRALGWERIIMVQNTAFVGGPDLLPFDLRQKRVTCYSSAPDAAERATERRKLQVVLVDALTAIFSLPSAAQSHADLKIAVASKRLSSNASAQVYELVTAVTNASDRRIDDWELEIDFPTPFLTGTHYAARVEQRSNERRTVLLWQSSKQAEPAIRPEETLPITIQFVVTKALYDRRDGLLDAPVKASVSVDGRVVTRESQPLRHYLNSLNAPEAAMLRRALEYLAERGREINVAASAGRLDIFDVHYDGTLLDQAIPVLAPGLSAQQHVISALQELQRQIKTANGHADLWRQRGLPRFELRAVSQDAIGIENAAARVLAGIKDMFWGES
jgi:hypothetical protein